MNSSSRSACRSSVGQSPSVALDEADDGDEAEKRRSESDENGNDENRPVWTEAERRKAEADVVRAHGPGDE